VRVPSRTVELDSPFAQDVPIAAGVFVFTVPRVLVAHPKLVGGQESGVFESGLQGVGSLTVVMSGELSADSGDGFRPVNLHRPLNHVDKVNSPVGHPTASVVPEVAER
jgi:hypothetical protein